MAVGRRRRRRLVRRFIRKYRVRGISKRFRRTRRSRGHLRPSKITIRRPIIADKAYVKLKYTSADDIGIEVNSVIPVLWNFRANSCYDCDYTNTGHQPAGWDQWKVFWNEYRVVACKAKVRFLNNGNVPMNCIIIASDQVSQDTPNTWSIITPELIRELNFTRVKLIGGSTTPWGCATMKHYMTTARITGKPLNQQDDLNAPVNDNPSHTWFYQIGIQRVAEDDQYVSVEAHATVVVELKYYIEFSGRKNYYPDI